ncbi:MAG: hypothetical protein EOP48_27245, partial [Sphingobacteriales bacterium]
MSKFLITDYNIGTGNKDYRTDSDSAFLIRFNYVRLTERMFRKIGKDMFAGLGLSINYRDRIDDNQLATLGSTPHQRYNDRNGFSSSRYSVNSLLLAFQYNTREHPLRSYGGTYADFNLALTEKWLGSTENAVQFIYDLRKYVSLSKKNPEHVLAFWHLGSYKLAGEIPYLALQATGYDLYNRSGRGYTIGRFKGPMFAYFETEYRFPITRNKFLSGVAFINFQSASDDLNKKLFNYIEPAIANLSAYGHKIRELLILACTEVECLLVKALIENGYDERDRYSTNDYVKCKSLLGLDDFEVKLIQYSSVKSFRPFKGWDASSPTKTLLWYNAYNSVKHNRS